MQVATVAEWAEELYDENLPRITEEVDSKFCCVTEWIEMPMPARDEELRRVLCRSGPFLRQEVITGLEEAEEMKFSRSPLNILCFGDASGVGNELFEILKRRKMLGKSSKMIEVWTDLYKADALSVETIAAYLSSVPAWDLILVTASADPAESNDPDDIIAWTDFLVKMMLYLSQALLKKPESIRKGLCVVTTGAFANDEESHTKASLGICVGGFMFGMLNTMRTEMSDIRMHYVDMEYQVDDLSLESLATEVTRNIGFGENSVRFYQGARYVARQVQAEPRYSTDFKFKTPATGVIAIGGGNGALGLVMGKYLLEHVHSEDDPNKKLTLEFISRSCRISGDGNLKLWQDIQQLAQEKNVLVQQVSCDVASRTAVETFIAQHGSELKGWIHSAGVLRDGLMINQTAEKFEDVYRPKSWAALYLSAALDTHCPNLEFLWMFSSVAVFGNPGQSNYSGANSFLDTLSRHRLALGRPSTVMQWAGWGEVGMASQLEGLAKKRMEESHIPLFTNAQGLHGMDVGLSTGLPVFCVMRYNTASFLKEINKSSKNPNDIYFTRFWSAQAPAKALDELDLYEAVVNQFHKPKAILYDFFIDHFDYFNPKPIHTIVVPSLAYDDDIEDADPKKFKNKHASKTK
uniref:Ketoreductase domain-containing protein n=1 Tax=Aureoumbra lagunensis TaxID=44058 RepID=A0A7S3K4W9_9STRA|mmetsp:Transcript_9223/g.14205  ORF Transcript_9223/g.14205 Transcript_9223/m.14205 type:complete len:634 (+) Transcript_9223:48-1949(+)